MATPGDKYGVQERMSHHFNFEMHSDSTDSINSSLSSNSSTDITDNGVFRIVVMGAAGVGKTCLISQFLYKTFHKQYKATVEELHRGEFEINGQLLTLDILDTSGAYEFPAMRRLAISNGDAFILVYSLQDEESFEEVRKLRGQILDQKNNDFTPIVIVRNKSDCTKEKQISQLLTVNLDWNNGYIEASAKDNTNIEDILHELLTRASVSWNPKLALGRSWRSNSNTVMKFQKKNSKRLYKGKHKHETDNCSIC